MTQSFQDKCAAIESLLGFLFAHLDHVPGAAKTARQEWISERSPLDDPPKPPAMYNFECKAHCLTCKAAYAKAGHKPQCPPDELWIREYAALRQRYRIADLERSLLRLGETDVVMAQAVWAVWVEPWPGELCLTQRPALGVRTEAIGIDVRLERAVMAEAGVEWMAEDIDGEVYGYAEQPAPRDNQIRQLASQGYTRRRIAKELRCSLRDVQRVLLPERYAVSG